MKQDKDIRNLRLHIFTSRYYSSYYADPQEALWTFDESYKPLTASHSESLLIIVYAQKYFVIL